MREDLDLNTVNIHCPSCGYKFLHKKNNSGEIKGGLGGVAAGAIIGAGLGQTSGEEVEELLTEKTREKHRFTAPPHGLFLYNVEY